MQPNRCCTSKLILIGKLGTVRVHRLQKSGYIVYTQEMPWMETNATEQRLVRAARGLPVYRAKLLPAADFR
jgi:hypothetical protein